MRGSRLYFREGELIQWSPRLAARMVWRGVQIDSRLPTRLWVAGRVWEVFRAWYAWTTALPGDRFWCVQRDVIVEVSHGLPSHRKARIVSGYYKARFGDEAFRMAVAEPCGFAWWEVRRV